MSTPSSRPIVDLEALVHHREFLCRIAQGIVQDRDDAEEVVQETWAHVLRRPPEHTRGLRSYLGTLAQNIARTRARSERRRKSREREGARAEQAPSSADVVERLTLQKEIAEAILELSEPHRMVVLLRFYEGLPPRKIASRLNLPVETVKSRQKAALIKLRHRLRHRKEGLIAIAAYPLTPVTTIPWSAGTLSTAGAAATLVIGATIAITHFKSPGSPPQEPPTSLTAPTQVFSSSPALFEPPSRLAVVSGPDQKLASPSETSPTEFTMRCQTREGIRVKDAEVWIYQLEDSADGFKLTGTYRTNAQGECSCPIRKSPSSWYRLAYAVKPDEYAGIAYHPHFPKSMPALKTTDLDVMMFPAISIEGHVDVSPRHRVEDAVVQVASIVTHRSRKLEDNWNDEFFSINFFSELKDIAPPFLRQNPDPYGHFVIPNIPEGSTFHASVIAEGLGEQQFMQFGKDPLDPDGFRVELAPEGLVSGVVLDGQQPVAGAKVVLQRLGDAVMRARYECQTDESGRFLFRGLGEDTHAIIEVSRDNGALFAPYPDLEVRAGENLDLVLQSQRSITLHGVVTDTESGEPVAGAGVSVLRRLANGQNGPSLGFMRTEAQGEYELDLPEGEVYVYLSGVPDGYSYPRPEGQAKLLSGDVPRHRLDLKVPRSPKGSVKLKVTDEKGAPLENAFVYLSQLESDEPVEPPRYWKTATGENGLKIWRGIPKGQYQVVVGESVPGRGDVFEVKSDEVSLTFELQTVRFEIIDVNRRPLDSYRLEIYAQENGENSRPHALDRPENDTLWLPEGTFTVTVSSPGYRARTQTLSIPLQESEVRFMLRGGDS